MPEGDTIFRAARTLHRALAGLTITSFHAALEPLAAVDRQAQIAGRTIVEVRAHGKHLLMTLSDDLVLRTHMRMHGSWHIYRPGERWRAPRRDARIVITTAEWVAIAFAVNDAEFLTADQVARHPRLTALGPDLLADDLDAAEVRDRMRQIPARHIADALLRQQSMAGLGNVYKSELLFLCGVWPFAPVASVTDEALECLITRARQLIRLNVQERSLSGGGGGGRFTTGRLNPREKLWVYDRAGQRCRKCDTPISSEMETDGRRTYWCALCQPPLG